MNESLNPRRAGKFRVLFLAVLAVLTAGAVAIVFSPLGVLHRSSRSEILVSGNIEAHESVLSVKAVQSRIVELPFDEGQWVQEGTLLARLEDADYRQQVSIDTAGLRVQARQLSASREALDAATKTVLADEADLTQKSLDFKRIQRLWRQGVESAERRDLAETALKQSHALYQRDRAMVNVAKRNLAVAQANVRSAHEKLRMSQIMLGYTVLRAPFAGVILVRQAELGEVILPGTPVVILADLDHVWLRAYVNETDLAKLRWGQAAVLHVDTYPDKRYQGRISFISSEAEFTPKSVETHAERVTLVYRVKIDVDNSSHELKPGMPADAVIDIQSSPANG